MAKGLSVLITLKMLLLSESRIWQYEIGANLKRFAQNWLFKLLLKLLLNPKRHAAEASITWGLFATFLRTAQRITESAGLKLTLSKTSLIDSSSFVLEK